MPLAVNEKNLKKVFESHLHAGEQSLAFVMVGARGVLGLTSQNRMIHSNFPFFGKAKILDEYYLSDIFSAQCNQTNTYTMMILIDAKGEKKKYKSTITPFVDSKVMANELIALIMKKNGNARPSYLDAEEQVIENLSCKEALYTVTDKSLIKLNKSGDMDSKKNWLDYKEFDYYPGKMESMYLYFEDTKGNSELLNFQEDSYSLLQPGKNKSSHNIIENFKKLFGKDKMPQYLQGNYPLSVFRAGTSLMGAVNPSHVIKIFEDRFLDLIPEKNGKLKVEKSVSFDSVSDMKVVRNRGQNSTGDIYEMKMKLADGSKLKYSTASQNIMAIKKIRQLIAN